jgi:hypothetical protein
MLTGLYPIRHSVRMNGSMALPESARTLAERARERGFTTGAVIAAAVLRSDFGLDQGFELYDDGADGLVKKRDAAFVADRAIRWLDERDRDRPFFLWAHFFDPHQPYRAPEPFVERAGGEPYLGEVAYMDHHVGRLLERVREEGLLDEIIVVAVSDHGEGLGRHGEPTHGICGFDSTLAVPLLIRHPDGWGAGRRSQEIVSVVDVYSTLIEATGLGSPGDVDGYSLFRREIEAERGVYFESYFGYFSFGWSQLSGWADARGKYVFSSSPEFYEVPTDPREQHNRVGELDGRIARYRSEIETIAARESLPPTGLGGEAGDLQETIEKLGYAGASSPTFEMPRPLQESVAPSPHQRIGTYVAYQAALAEMKAGNHEEAIASLREIVAEDPGNHTAHSKLGAFLLRLGRHEQALAPLHKALELRGGEWTSVCLQLAECLDELGEIDRAILYYERGFAHGVGPLRSRQRLIELLERSGRHDDAQRHRLQAMGLGGE